jgi:hypothetical protein
VLFDDEDGELDSVKNLKHPSGKYELLGIKNTKEFFYIEVSINEFLYNEEVLSIKK